MIAAVYPLKRMPRKCGVFDYVIPKNLTVKRGDLVMMPFRGALEYGVVAQVKDHSLRGIELKELKQTTPYTLTEEELSFFEWMARDLIQSVPSLLYATLPTPPKRARSFLRKQTHQSLTIPSDEASTIGRNAQELSKCSKAFVHASDLRRTAAVIAKYIEMHPQQKCLILAPTVHDAQLLGEWLHQNDGIITGESTNNECFDIWQVFQAKRYGYVIGTTQALLLVGSDVQTIFLVRSGHESHKQSERNPRFDARLIALRLSERFKTHVYFFDVIPRVDDLAFFLPEQMVFHELSTPLSLINKRHEQQASPHPVMSYSAAQCISDVLKQGRAAVCVYNKKGKAQRLSCQDCSYAFACSTCGGLLRVWSHTVSCAKCTFVGPTPLSCPQCKSANIFERGYGNERVAQALESLFHVPVGIVDKEHPNVSNHPIRLVTQYEYEHHFNPFVPSDVGIVILLDADAPLFSPSFRALEKALYQAETWRGYAHAQRAGFMIQTDAPDLFEEFYENAHAVFDRELAQRIAFDLPPKRRWVQISSENEEMRKAEIQAAVLAKDLKALSLDIKLTGPVFDEKNKWHIDVGFLPHEFDQAFQLFTALDDHYIIDTHLYSC